MEAESPLILDDVGIFGSEEFEFAAFWRLLDLASRWNEASLATVQLVDLTRAEAGFLKKSPRLNEIIKARRSVTPDTALRLARLLGMPADFWLGLQSDWDLWHAMHSDRTKEIEALIPLELP